MLVALRRLAIVTVLVAAAVTWSATPAQAITSTSTTPADGSTVQPPVDVRVVHDVALDTTASTITVANKNLNLVAGEVTFSTTDFVNDTIVFTPSSTLGQLGSSYSVSVHAEDLVGTDEVDTAFVFSVDTTSPVAPTITSVENPVNAANQTTLTVGGGTDDDTATVTVSVDDANPATSAVSTTVAADGSFSADVDVSTLDNGTLDVRVRATDEAGNESTEATAQTTKDSAVPAAPGLTIVDDPITAANQGAVDITGTSGEADLTIVVSVDDTNSGTAAITRSTTTAAGGAWAVEMNLTSLSEGTITASATATDAVGNTSPVGTDAATKELGPPLVISTSPADESIVHPPAEITATFSEPLDTADSTITLVDSTEVSIAGTKSFRDGNSTIVFTPTGALSPGGSPYTVTIAVQDVANNAGAPTEFEFTITNLDFISSSQSVTGTYTPIPGDFNGDGAADIFWYAPGTAPDPLWLSNSNSTFTSAPQSVSGTYTPIPGDHDGDGTTDIFWYAPGTAPDTLWLDRKSTRLNSTHEPQKR
ncbi:MAG: FG-GAP-like repeat-containing protein, partial [Microthrixaceae bacterium]